MPDVFINRDDTTQNDDLELALALSLSMQQSNSGVEITQPETEKPGNGLSRRQTLKMIDCERAHGKHIWNLPHKRVLDSRGYCYSISCQFDVNLMLTFKD